VLKVVIGYISIKMSALNLSNLGATPGV